MADLERLPLPSGKVAYLKKKLTHGEAQEIESAQLVASVDTKGAFRDAIANIEALLLATPQEWREQYKDTVLAGIRLSLEQYETDVEGALSKTETRQRMADGTLALLDTYGRVFLHPSSEVQWPPEDGMDARVIRRRAQVAWNRWQREMNAALKDDGAGSEDGSGPETDA
jgi:hypothetical protein